MLKQYIVEYKVSFWLETLSVGDKLKQKCRLI